MKCKECARCFKHKGVVMCDMAIPDEIHLDDEACEYFEKRSILKDCLHFIGNECSILNKLYCEKEPCAHYKPKGGIKR